MNKTIYLRDEEGPVWERARELAGDKLSPVIVSALKQFIAAKEAEPKGFKRIEVGFDDSDDHYLPKKKAFYGRWIFSPTAPCYSENDGPNTYNYAVATTARGNAAFFSWLEDQNGESWSFKFVVYPSLERAAADERLNFAARKAIEKIGVPVEELDI